MSDRAYYVGMVISRIADLQQKIAEADDSDDVTATEILERAKELVRATADALKELDDRCDISYRMALLAYAEATALRKRRGLLSRLRDFIS